MYISARQLKTHIAFSMFPILDTNLCTYCGTTHPMFRSHRQFLKWIVDLTSKVVDFRPSTLNKSRYVSVSSIIFWMLGFQFFCSFLVKIFHCPSLKSHWHWNDGFTQFVRHLMKPRLHLEYVMNVKIQFIQKSRKIKIYFRKKGCVISIFYCVCK